MSPPALQGATDLEKQLELLLVENQRLKTELKSCKSPDGSAESCSQRSSSQVGDTHSCTSPKNAAGSTTAASPFHLQEAHSLRREVLHWEQQLAQLQREVAEKGSSLESLHQQLEEARRRRRRQAEQKLPEEELAKHAATPPRVKVRRPRVKADAWLVV